MYAKILKLAQAYGQQTKFTTGLIKKASIESDLAIRIMHSLIPKATEHPLEAQFVQTHLTQKHLIGVAERYMERAAKIIKEEMIHSKNTAAIKRISFAFNAKKYLSVARIASKEFAHDNWEEGFGGKRWRQFADHLSNLGFAIKAFKKSINENNNKAKQEAAGMISVYMNVLDGLTHNTGSFLDKMIRNESDDIAESIGESSDEIYLKRKQKAFEMMDIKQLRNADDVLPFLKEYIYGNPEGYLYREYYSKLLSEARPNMDKAREELAQIRKKKGLINGIDRSIDVLINKMERDARSGDFSNLKDYYNYIIGITNSSRWKDAASVTIPILQKYNLQKQFNELSSQPEALNRMLEKPRIIQRLLKHYMIQQGGQGEYMIQYEGTYYKATCKGTNCVIEPSGPIPEHGQQSIYLTRQNLIYIFIGSEPDNKQKYVTFLQNMIRCAREIRQSIVSYFDLGLASLDE